EFRRVLFRSGESASPKGNDPQRPACPSGRRTAPVRPHDMRQPYSRCHDAGALAVRRGGPTKERDGRSHEPRHHIKPSSARRSADHSDRGGTKQSHCQCGEEGQRRSATVAAMKHVISSNPAPRAGAPTKRTEAARRSRTASATRRANEGARRSPPGAAVTCYSRPTPCKHSSPCRSGPCPPSP